MELGLSGSQNGRSYQTHLRIGWRETGILAGEDVEIKELDCKVIYKCPHISVLFVLHKVW